MPDVIVTADKFDPFTTTAVSATVINPVSVLLCQLLDISLFINMNYLNLMGFICVVQLMFKVGLVAYVAKIACCTITVKKLWPYCFSFPMLTHID